jgi:hypothetical protein
MNCPICDADIILDGDERPGDSVYCSYCNSQLKVRLIKGTEDIKLVDDN